MAATATELQPHASREHETVRSMPPVACRRSTLFRFDSRHRARARKNRLERNVVVRVGAPVDVAENARTAPQRMPDI